MCWKSKKFYMKVVDFLRLEEPSINEGRELEADLLDHQRSHGEANGMWKIEFPSLRKREKEGPCQVLDIAISKNGR